MSSTDQPLGPPPWPRLRIILDDDHTGTVQRPGHTIAVSGDDVDDLREKAHVVAVEQTVEIGRPLFTDITEPDDVVWEIVIHPDGHVEDVPTKDRRSIKRTSNAGPKIEDTDQGEVDVLFRRPERPTRRVRARTAAAGGLGVLILVTVTALGARAALTDDQPKQPEQTPAPTTDEAHKAPSSPSNTSTSDAKKEAHEPPAKKTMPPTTATRPRPGTGGGGTPTKTSPETKSPKKPQEKQQQSKPKKQKSTARKRQ